MANVSSSNSDVPTQAKLKQAADNFEADWGAVDKVLYGICRRYPDHVDRQGVFAKIVLIGRAYSTGLERCIKPEGQQAVAVVAEYLYEHHTDIDAIMADLPDEVEFLTTEIIRHIVDVHGRFCALLRQLKAVQKTPRSFAAKYLHFHNRMVPIFDSYALDALSGREPWDATQLPFDAPDGADEEYYEFCVPFWRLYEACLQEGREVTVKTLDAYLWSEARTSPERTARGAG